MTYMRVTAPGQHRKQVVKAMARSKEGLDKSSEFDSFALM
jgi:hypothetical protein